MRSRNVISPRQYNTTGTRGGETDDHLISNYHSHEKKIGGEDIWSKLSLNDGPQFDGEFEYQLSVSILINNNVYIYYIQNFGSSYIQSPSEKLMLMYYLWSKE